MISWDSISSTTDSTTSSWGSLISALISVPNTNSSIDDGSLENGRPERSRQEVYKGQLRIDINVTKNYITAHIVAARNLGAKMKSKPNCFVEITIIPESRVHSKCLSTIYHSSHRPVFDEKVSMELPLNFESKRLLVTVYHNRQPHKNYQMMGCMSFGLHRIHKGSSCQLANGWYYLLDEDIGKRRHVKVIENALNVKTYSPSMNISKLLMCRTLDGGFGFSVIGSSPVRICRAKKGSIAELHNLQKDDAILAIDSRDVSRCTSVEVSSIIRSTKHFMTVAVQRGPHYTCDRNEDRVKNGMVAKLIKKIFYSGNQNNTSTTATAKSSSDILVDYGWLENEKPHSHGGASASSTLRKHPHASLDGAHDFHKVIQKHPQPNLSSRGQENVSENHRGIRSVCQDGIESDPGAFDQGRHSNRELNVWGCDDDSDGNDYDDLQSSNFGRMSKMLSPVVECDSRIQSDSLFIGSDDVDDTCEDDSRGTNDLGDSQNNIDEHDPAAVENDELHCEFSQSIYDDNDNKGLSTSLMNDSRPTDYDENGYLDFNDSKYDEDNLNPRKSCQLYCDEHHDLNQKENLFPTKPRRTEFASHHRTFRRNHPLTPRENFSPHCLGVFQETPASLKGHEVDGDALSSILGTPSAPQKGRKGKAVVSRIKTIFKNRHAS